MLLSSYCCRNMAVDRIVNATKTTERVNIDIDSFVASYSEKRDPRLRNAGIPYGQRLCRVGQQSCSNSTCSWCNTRK